MTSQGFWFKPPCTQRFGDQLQAATYRGGRKAGRDCMVPRPVTAKRMLVS
jgi:hypothetical protein